LLVYYILYYRSTETLVIVNCRYTVRHFLVSHKLLTSWMQKSDIPLSTVQSAEIWTICGTYFKVSEQLTQCATVLSRNFMPESY